MRTSRRRAIGTALLAAMFHASVAGIAAEWYVHKRTVHLRSLEIWLAPTAAPPAHISKVPPKQTPSAAHERSLAPPAVALAPKLLTSPNAPVDLTGTGFVAGEGNDVVSGALVGSRASPGPPSAAVTTAHSAPRAPPPLPVFNLDQSRPASFAGSTSWNCPFPPEADVDDVNQAFVTIVVTVGPDGTVLSVKVVSDPGSGFGAAARRCAFGQRFTPALDGSGRPISGTTAPIRVRFVR